tara:strand:- start:475 stop:897 length:423 start_codon:yes stop_codon:yes gene_type:complete
MNENTYGRTLNVPKELPAGILPGPSYNGGVTIGEKCSGAHCSIPVTPTSGYMVYNNLRSANPPKEALYHYPSTYRLGNNSDINPNIAKYTGTRLNPGPFNIEVRETAETFKYITNPATGIKVNTKSREGRHILEKYINYS